ncbi:MFS transporter [Streptomyces sp. NPDC050738]|uniref:MFS transporter n=1 Tax=Streptomyces sp. NPDC050738 TaxID=3154744 RepID=UPI0034328A52
MKDTSAPGLRRPGLSLATVVLASFLLPISLTGASVAMPGVAENFHNSLAAGQWIVNGYDLTFASFMLACGAFADRFGRRKVFAIGSAVFALASLVSAFAGGIVVLDVARAVAGVGAAAVLTSGSALLAQTFDGPARAKAFGVFGTAVGIGQAFGPFVSGALSTAFGWRAIFLVPAVFGGIVVGLSVLLPESRDPGAKRVDWAGTFTLTTALASLIAALLEGPGLGWGHGLVVGGFLLSALLFGAFVVAERRRPHPMADLTLFRQPQFASLCAAAVAMVAGFTPLLVYLPSYLTAVNAQTTLHAGVDLLMLTVPTIFFPLVAGYLQRWIAVRHLVTASVGLPAAGVAWLTVIEPGIGNWASLGPFLVIGIGVGIAFGVQDGAAVSSVEPSRAGMAAGMFNTMRLGGEAVAIAVAGTLLVSFTRLRLGSQLDRFPGPYANHPETLAALLNQGQLQGPAATVPAGMRDAFTSVASSAYTDGLHSVLWVMAGFCAAVTVLVAVVGARHTAPASLEAAQSEPATEPATESAPETAPAPALV